MEAHMGKSSPRRFMLFAFEKTPRISLSWNTENTMIWPIVLYSGCSIFIGLYKASDWLIANLSLVSIGQWKCLFMLPPFTYQNRGKIFNFHYLPAESISHLLTKLLFASVLPSESTCLWFQATWPLQGLAIVSQSTRQLCILHHCLLKSLMSVSLTPHMSLTVVPK